MQQQLKAAISRYRSSVAYYEAEAAIAVKAGIPNAFVEGMLIKERKLLEAAEELLKEASTKAVAV